MAPGQYSTDPKQHTLSPIVTGATVIGMKYKDGVILAADTLASYGSEARYKDVCRLKKVGEYTLLGGGGELSDFQYLSDQLDEMADEDEGGFISRYKCPKEYSSYIGRVMYNRRSKFNPLYNQFVVVGKKKASCILSTASGSDSILTWQDEPAHLMYVDHQGTAFEENFVATGFGMHLGIPLLRNSWRLDEAKALATKCLEVCFYRDCRAYCKIHIGVCNGTSVDISAPIPLNHFWGHGAWTEKRLEDDDPTATWRMPEGHVLACVIQCISSPVHRVKWPAQKERYWNSFLRAVAPFSPTIRKERLRGEDLRKIRAELQGLSKSEETPGTARSRARSRDLSLSRQATTTGLAEDPPPETPQSQLENSEIDEAPHLLRRNLDLLSPIQEKKVGERITLALSRAMNKISCTRLEIDS
eukprot:g32518.t2